MISFVPMYSNGVKTNRDAWVYNFSRISVEKNSASMIGFYNQQVDNYIEFAKNNHGVKVEEFIDTNPEKISWSRALREDLARNKK